MGMPKGNCFTGARWQQESSLRGTSQGCHCKFVISESQQLHLLSFWPCGQSLKQLMAMMMITAFISEYKKIHN